MASEFTPDAERIELALHASWDAEACTMTALEQLQRGEDDGPTIEQLAVARALLMRSRDMSRIIMAALGDKLHKPEDLRLRLQLGE